MKRNLSVLDEYTNRVYKIIVLIIPIYCICASATISLMQYKGWYPPLDPALWLLFVASTFFYLAVGIYFVRTGFNADGVVYPHKLKAAKLTMATIVIVQWNAISYLWPLSDFWAYVLLFIIVEAFFFDVKFVAWTTVGILLSLIVSWIFGSEMLLPPHDDFYYSSLFLRIVGLTLMLFSINVITYFGGKFLVGTLEQYIIYDPLTHLLNRRNMHKYLTDAHRQAASGDAPFSLIMMDIDNFKKINDTYGHECGDEVLRFVAGTITCSVQKQDKVFRWGGEEVLILLRGTKEQAVSAAERIRRDIEKSPVKYRGDTEIAVTVTFGVAPYRSGVSLQDMMDEADKNLYYGKNHGKNQVVCHEP